MNSYSEEEKLIRWYLLGAVSPEEEEQVEQRSQQDEEYGEQLLLAEEDLIDDYARGQMPEGERDLFEQNFLTTLDRRQKLVMAQAAVKYAEAFSDANTDQPVQANVVAELDSNQIISSVAQSNIKVQEAKPKREWWQMLFAPKWKMAVYATVVLGVVISGWWSRRSDSEVEKGMIALNKAYRTERPLEARISRLSYAPFIVTKGDAPGNFDYRAGDLAEKILLEAVDKDANASAYHALGRLYLARKDINKANDQFDAALKAGPGSAQLYSDYAVALFEKGKLERLDVNSGKSEVTLAKSLEFLNKALELDDSLPEPLFDRALLHQYLNLTNLARGDWERYLERDSTSPWAEEARRNLKLIEEGRKRVSQNNEQLYQSFIQAYRMGNDEDALRHFSLSYNYSGNFIAWKLIEGFLGARLGGRTEDAREQLQTLSYAGELVAKKTGDRFIADLASYYQRSRPQNLAALARARALMREGFGLYQAAKNEQAIERYSQAKQLFGQAGDAGETLLADALIGHSHHMRSDPKSSREIFTSLNPICAKKNYSWMQAQVLCGLANAHESANEFSQAIEASLQARQLAERIGDDAGLVRCLSLLGNYYYNLGKHEENLLLSAHGREICNLLPADPSRQSGFYMLPALSLTALGHYGAALSYQNEILMLAAGVKAPRLFARLHVQMGRSYAGLNRHDLAIQSIQQGIAIGRELQADKTGREFIAHGLLSLGYVYYDDGKQEDALKAFNQVIDFHRQDDRQVFLYQARKGRLMALIAQGNDAAAREELDKVVTAYESYREQIYEESNRNSFYNKEQDVYDLAVDFAQFRLRDTRRAFDYLELSRARSLLNASRRDRAVILNADLPDLRFVETIQPVGVEEIKQQLPEGVQLLEYAALKDRLLIWLIAKDTPVESRVVEVSLNELTKRVNRYVSLLGQPPGSDDGNWREQGKELYDLLIRPFETKLDNRKQLCVVPDKALTRLPFGTLVIDRAGHVLIENFRVSYASSANLFLFSTAMAKRRSGTGSERLLAVGNPRFDRNLFPTLADLPSAAQEAVAVADFYNAPLLLTGAKAKKEVVLKELGQSDVVHLAMHYLPSERSPMLSQLPLAVSLSNSEGDNVLRMYEIYRLSKLPARLVVLSACQTTTESYFRGEGAIGFSRPFQAAGIPLVVASLWPVEAGATAELMTELHRLRKQSHLSTAEAITKAQQKLLHSAGQYNHPYYWAAFITIGGYSEY